MRDVFIAADIPLIQGGRTPKANPCMNVPMQGLGRCGPQDVLHTSPRSPNPSACLVASLNDVVLASVSIALGRYLRAQGHDTEGLTLKAMVPVSVRADMDRKSLPTRLRQSGCRDVGPTARWDEDPVACLRQIARAMNDLKESGQAVGAQVLIDLAGFAPPTILSQAARLQARQRFFNLVVTNVPGPQFPLYLLGRRLQVLYPVVPLARRQALGIAVMSYDGHLGFGLLADYDALPEFERLARDLRWAVSALARAAGVSTSARAQTRSGARNGARSDGGQADGRSPRRKAGESTRARRSSVGKPPAVQS